MNPMGIGFGAVVSSYKSGVLHALNVLHRYVPPIVIVGEPFVIKQVLSEDNGVIDLYDLLTPRPSNLRLAVLCFGGEMRRLLTLIMCGLVPYVAYGAGMTDYNAIISQQQDVQQNIQADFESVRAKVENLNPELVAQSRDKPEKVQVAIYRSWLARQMFEYYKDYFIKKIEDRAAQTGRMLKIHDYGLNQKTGCSYSVYSLDNGDLDLPKCQDKERGNLQICPYPDTLEEFYLDLYDCGDEMGMNVMEDDASKDFNNYYSMDISNKKLVEDDEIYTDMYLSTSFHAQSFKEWARYREQERQWTLRKRPDNGSGKVFRKTRRGTLEFDVPPTMPGIQVFGLKFGFASDDKGND